jgi:hypothetical protein
LPIAASWFLGFIHRFSHNGASDDDWHISCFWFGAAALLFGRRSQFARNRRWLDVWLLGTAPIVLIGSDSWEGETVITLVLGSGNHLWRRAGWFDCGNDNRWSDTSGITGSDVGIVSDNLVEGYCWCYAVTDTIPASDALQFTRIYRKFDE